MVGTTVSEVLVEKAFVEIPPDLDKRSIISLLAKSLVANRRIKAAELDEVVDVAMAREAIGSTGIGHGIAIPHCKTNLVKKFSCAFGHCPSGLDFDSLDREAVHSVFFVIIPKDQKEQHLELMKNFATLIKTEHFCGFLRQVSNQDELVRLLTEFEGKIS